MFVSDLQIDHRGEMWKFRGARQSTRIKIGGLRLLEYLYVCVQWDVYNVLKILMRVQMLLNPQYKGPVMFRNILFIKTMMLQYAFNNTFTCLVLLQCNKIVDKNDSWRHKQTLYPILILHSQFNPLNGLILWSINTSMNYLYNCTTFSRYLCQCPQLYFKILLIYFAQP